MQWVIPGFEAEQEPVDSTAPEAPASRLLLHRRSYKGFNGMVEHVMKEPNGQIRSLGVAS